MNSEEIKAGIWAGVLSFLGRLPLSVLYKFGDFVSWVMNRLVQYRKSEVYINLSRSFPDKSYAWIRNVADDYYRHLGEVVAETIWFAGCKGRPERLRKQNLYTYSNLEVLENARDKRGVICMKSHRGNWEVYGAIFEFNYDTDILEHFTVDDFHVAYKGLHNKVSDKVFLRLRSSVIKDTSPMVEEKRVLRHIMKHKDERPIYTLIADQYPYQTCHDLGTFLNQPTKAMLAGFTIAHKLGFTVLYIRDERLERGKYKAEYEVLSEDASKDAPEMLMRKYFDLLEEDIRNKPADWLWSHRRWHY